MRVCRRAGRSCHGLRGRLLRGLGRRLRLGRWLGLGRGLGLACRLRLRRRAGFGGQGRGIAGPSVSRRRVPRWMAGLLGMRPRVRLGVRPGVGPRTGTRAGLRPCRARPRRRCAPVAVVHRLPGTCRSWSPGWRLPRRASAGSAWPASMPAARGWSAGLSSASAGFAGPAWMPAVRFRARRP